MDTDEAFMQQMTPCEHTILQACIYDSLLVS